MELLVLRSWFYFSGIFNSILFPILIGMMVMGGWFSTWKEYPIYWVVGILIFIATSVVLGFLYIIAAEIKKFYNLKHR